MIDQIPHKKILVAPLNWGLGHATRCIPVIEALQKYDFEPVLAGDGASLELLQQEFPGLTSYELPSTRVLYPENARYLKLKLLCQAPRLVRAVQREQKRVEEIHHIENLSGIISDNRFGVRLKGIPSVYITHQVQVLSGSTSLLTTAAHQRMISKFDECWIPDDPSDRLAGRLSTPSPNMNSYRYIGPLSRFKGGEQDKELDIVAVLSGPEPQRSILEEILRNQLGEFKGKSLIVQGVVEKQQRESSEGNARVVNFMLQEELEITLLRSKLILSRSGYSSVMDLHALKAKVFFIPTPGQFEQEYLAFYLKEKGLADYSAQDEFKLERLENAKNYSGFAHKKTSKNSLERSLFDVFLQKSKNFK